MEQLLRGSITRTFKFDVTTAVQELVSKDDRRICVFLYNGGAATVSILSAKTQDYTDGIPVASGGTYKNNTTTAALYIVTASGTATVQVQVDGD